MKEIIDDHLSAAKHLAEKEGNPFLVYLINMARMENDPEGRQLVTQMYAEPLKSNALKQIYENF